MWFLYLLLTYTFFLSFAFYNARTKWKYLRCSEHHIFSKNAVFLFFILLFLLFFSTLRFPKEATDTANYFRLFDEINSPNYQVKFTLKPEWGYWSFNKLIGIFTDSHQIFLFIINIFVLYSIFGFINKYSKNIWFSILLFIFLGYFDSTMTLIRFNIAVAFTLFSYQYLLKRKFLKFLFIVFIGSLFHISAWIFSISYLTKLKPISNRKYIIFLFSLLIVFLSTNFIIHSFFDLFTFYSSYENNETFGLQSSAKLAPILEFLILLSIVSFAHYRMRKKPQTDLETLLLYLAFIACYFTVLSFIFTPIGRIGKYFAIGTIILLPNVIEAIDNAKYKLSIKVLTLTVFLLRYFIIAYFRPEWYQIYPYKFFFE